MRPFVLELSRLGTDPTWQARLEILERMRNLVLLIRKDEIVYANAAAARWLAFPKPEAMVGCRLVELMHHDYVDMVGLGLDALTEEAVIPLKLIKANGGEMDAEMWVERLEMPGPPVYLIEARDVTEHLRSARALRSREQWLEGIINTVADGIVTIDDKGLIQTFNSAAERIFRFNADEVMGRSIRMLIPDPVPARETSADLDLHRLLPSAAEVTGMRKDGREVPLEIAVREMEQGGQVAYTSVVRDITLRKRAEERLRHLAHHDPLTGLPNRFLLADRLDAAINRAVRHHTPLAVIYIDLDRFKPVNDQYGHAVGDKLLVQVANDLAMAVRKTDTVARVGGDEFVALLEEVGSQDKAEELAVKLLEVLRRHRCIGEIDIRVAGSLGVAMFPAHGTTAEEILEASDASMYKAKRAGADCYCCHGGEPVFGPSRDRPGL
ncbi:MAG: diguanylate cyclase domain-containing protein [Actinomycetota bacterium]